MAKKKKKSSKKRPKKSASKKPKAPKIRTCGQMIMHNEMLEKMPSYRKNLMPLEHACARRVMKAVCMIPRTLLVPQNYSTII